MFTCKQASQGIKPAGVPISLTEFHYCSGYAADRQTGQPDQIGSYRNGYDNMIYKKELSQADDPLIEQLVEHQLFHD
jgi:hypothetical protein